MIFWTRFVSTSAFLLFLFIVPNGAFAVPMQSPIDIDPFNAQLSALPPLLFNYNVVPDLEVENLGSPDENGTIEGVVPFGDGSLTVGGTSYNLLQFHFHTLSEHTILGQTFDMEMHMVHQNTLGDLLVVGRFIDAGEFNAALDPIFGFLPQVSGTHETVHDFDLNDLLPDDLRSYRYDGSLTTPAFDEGLDWVVLNDVLNLSPDQIGNFQSLFPDGNAREVQDLNGRIVRTDVAPVPEPSTLLFMGTGLVGLLGYNRRRRKSAA